MYVQVIINDSFVFSGESVQFLRGTSTVRPSRRQLEELMTDDEDAPTLLKHIDQQITRPMHGKPPKGTAKEQYLQQKVKRRRGIVLRIMFRTHTRR